MRKSILSKNQKKFLSLFSESKLIDAFYLTGGTALAQYYLPYRYSEDLDFFAKKEFELMSIITFLKSLKKTLKYDKIDINTVFNRNIFQLIFSNQVLKLEFTYFPFPQIEKPKTVNGINIDSLLDIAVNKLFTIYQKPRSRDFIDLYIIHKKQGFTIEELTKKAKEISEKEFRQIKIKKV